MDSSLPSPPEDLISSSGANTRLAEWSQTPVHEGVVLQACRPEEETEQSQGSPGD
jgi:hypothetical protein